MSHVCDLTARINTTIQLYSIWCILHNITHKYTILCRIWFVFLKIILTVCRRQCVWHGIIIILLFAIIMNTDCWPTDVQCRLSFHSIRVIILLIYNVYDVPWYLVVCCYYNIASCQWTRWSILRVAWRVKSYPLTPLGRFEKKLFSSPTPINILSPFN